MSVDTATVKRVAKLARIAVDDEAAERMTGELKRLREQAATMPAREAAIHCWTV